MIAHAQTFGDIAMLVNAAGISPSQASIESILKVDLYDTAVLLEEVGKVIKKGGSGVTISSQSGYRLPALTPDEDEQLAATPSEALLALKILQPRHIRDTLHAYQLADAATPNASWQKPSNGAKGARALTLSPPASLSPAGNG